MISLNRRKIVCGIALTLSPRAASAQSVIPFALRIYIPSPAVIFAGSTFNGGDKVLLTGAINLAASGAAALSVNQRTFGETRQYAAGVAQPVAGKPSWYGALPSGAAPIKTDTAQVTDSNLKASWEVPAGATHGARLWVVGANPIPLVAPAIDADILVGLRRTGGVVQFTLNAAFDGFPSYELKLNGTPVLDHDCIVTSQGPSDLVPPMDRSKITPWTTL
jgi:hypothetical protein